MSFRRGDVIDWAAIRRRLEELGLEDRGESRGRDRELALLDARARELRRPRDAPAEADTIDLVAFERDGELYGLDARYVIAAFPLERPALLPGASAPVAGAVAWKGRILVLLDIASAAPTLRGAAFVLAVGKEEPAFGLLASSIAGLRRVPTSAIGEAPEGLDRRDLILGLTSDAMLVLDGAELLDTHT